MTDWHVWHEQYEDPSSSLSRRLEAVRSQLARVLEARAGLPTRLVSLCSGDGRDTLPVLAAVSPGVDALLVELDPALCAAARDAATALGLSHVAVRCADAGALATLHDVPPADVLMLCGVFGNVRDDDVLATVAALPHFLRHEARVIWTRGRCVDPDPTDFDGDPSEMVRQVFNDAWFEEEAFVRPDDASFRVGVHRFASQTASAAPEGERLFTFVR